MTTARTSTPSRQRTDRAQHRAARTQRAPRTRRSPNGTQKLVIVESPAKARTIENILGDGYRVVASVGHVRDLPAYGYGIEDFESFKPKYVVIKDKKAGVDKSEIIKDIAEAARDADTVYLSTDPDREGEAISWHIVEAAGIPREKARRVIFHEITPPAIEEAFRHPTNLNDDLVEAQQARRVLDRLIGFPLTWFVQQKVARSASAGRVQSVALRLIVEREREIQSFVPQEYWTIHALLAKDGARFEAQLARLSGERGKPSIADETHANRLVDTFRRADFRVRSVKRGERRQSPAPPFTTSTYQQAANNRLGLGAQRAMTIAQQLYEGVNIPGEGPVGLITYMRTDSVHVSPVARREARAFIGQRWGSEYVPEKERIYRTRSRGAQEAHEAIRPTSPARTPESLRGILDDQQLRVYTLVWQRFMASQMADARFATVTVEIDAIEGGTNRGVFRASARQLVFPGHLAAYSADASDGPPAGNDDEEAAVAQLPELRDGDTLQRINVDGRQHFTEPPPRYTEASLVKALEEQGIGRPSTYATIVQTVQKRDYVKKEGRALVPQELGFLVNDLLVQHMDRYVAVPFTSELEEELDDIAAGKRDYVGVVKHFWEPFSQDLEAAKQRAGKAEQETDILCGKCGQAKMVIKWGRNGKFLACPRYPECKNAMPLTAEGEPVPVQGPTPTEYACPKCGARTIQKTGPFGPYIDCERRESGECDFRSGVPVGVPCPEEPETGQLVEKRTRRGTFYGCWNYPHCSYTTNSLEPDKMAPPRSPEEREEANRKLLERSARGKKAAATRRANRARTGTSRG
ncbi:MAG: type I DNA topoisomerase [Dehalococcoidia bacterium]